MKSWKTTLFGFLGMAAAGASEAMPKHSGWLGPLSNLLLGLGLFFARDNKVTSEQAGASPEKP